MIGICMDKLCDHSIYKPLEMIFKSSSNQGIFHAEWKKVNVVLVYTSERSSMREKLQTGFSSSSV